MFFGGILNWGNEIWIVFECFQGFLGPHPVTWIQRKSHRFGQSAHVDCVDTTA